MVYRVTAGLARKTEETQGPKSKETTGLAQAGSGAWGPAEGGWCWGFRAHTTVGNKALTGPIPGGESTELRPSEDTSPQTDGHGPAHEDRDSASLVLGSWRKRKTCISDHKPPDFKSLVSEV